MFSATTKDDRLVVTFPGRMDTLACSTLQHEVDERVGQGGLPVTFDMAGVGYVSSSFIRLCLKAARTAGADRFEMVNVSPVVKKVFKIAGLDGPLAIR